MNAPEIPGRNPDRIRRSSLFNFDGGLLTDSHGDVLLNTRKRGRNQFDDETEVTSAPSSHTSGNASTRRRKRLRRVRMASHHTDEMSALTKLFQHISILGRIEQYNKLNPDLVVADPDPLIVEYTLHNPPIIPNFKPEDYTFVKACTPVEMAHLKHFDREESVPQAEYLPSLQTASDIVGKLLSLPEYLFFPEVDDLNNVRYIGSKFPGIEYAMQGFKTRREAHEMAMTDALSAFDKLLNGERVKPHDVRLGGRGKVAEMDRTAAEAKPPAVGRLILMMSQRDLLLCGVTENLLTRAYTPAQFPIAVGQSWFHGGATEFVDRFYPYTEYFCFDAKKFDSSIDRWMVRIAINILRHQFFEGEESKYDAYWTFVEESLLDAPIYRDDGVRFQKHCGTTSGHSHNTLIQSIITLLLAYTTMLFLHPELSVEEILENMWAESLGDDNILGVKGPLAGHTVEEIAQVVYDIFRVDWFGKKSFKTTCLLDAITGAFQGLQFLGKYFRIGEYPTADKLVDMPIPYRPFKETYLRLLYPEYGAHTPTETWLRTLGNYLDAAGNPQAETWLSGLLTWLEDRVETPPEEWPANYKRMVSRDYSHVGIEVPKPVRINYEQWRDLVVMSRADYVNTYKPALVKQ
ncbi:RNA-dependent RNA polymerase [Trichoderma harzianum bipartite mycovirus 1]|uniref:RNA-dependent RNA polymerase n=1 Tax=Trichoderma harzianum bipartite mycovirus 1 TaxID=2315392 RepID=A0A346THI5_9VIRU|nr:RNA-dependent RNA polymerase [Trichoderma harzianum bipartite mycovirus 1]AXU24203.1 RNA-dependent RNA polymerase [Trichoderma harzianum bipartite mycovirus 1]